MGRADALNGASQHRKREKQANVKSLNYIDWKAIIYQSNSIDNRCTSTFGLSFLSRTCGYPRNLICPHRLNIRRTGCFAILDAAQTRTHQI
ncbi:hypothetical protein GJ496_009838 [Pomphorhynchus laevis]|nr:hypothetical protein GJ496_009838 [Pomphorhynchus laevis]